MTGFKVVSAIIVWLERGLCRLLGRDTHHLLALDTALGGLR